MDFDVAIIGSGPGGEGAAMQASKDGLRVCVIEHHQEVGGNCTHYATIPSKALRQAAYLLTVFQNDPFYGRYANEREASFVDILARARQVIQKQVSLRQKYYQRNEVEVIHGHAFLEDAHTISVEPVDGKPSRRVQAKFIILATGSRPYHPEGVDFEDSLIFDSDKILQLKQKPRVITICGAGIIGCEYTSIFRSLGHKVNLVNNREKLLNFLDNEIIDALSYHLREQGVIIRHQENHSRVETQSGKVILHLESGKKILSDIILFATGRRGNSDTMGLEDLKISITARGTVLTNACFQTSHPHIYAVGDLCGVSSLASTAYDQGRRAAEHISGRPAFEGASFCSHSPQAIYTSPEISCIGKTESELTAAQIPYEVGHASFKHLAKSQIVGESAGFLKILFHPKTLEVLGIHCFGREASEIIHIGQAIMNNRDRNSLEIFVHTTFNYPTMAEAYRVAALNGLNRVVSV